MIVLIAVSGIAADPGQQVLNSDMRISIDVDNITAGHLLHLLDQATGLTSSIPPELANRTTSIHLSGLPLNEAARRIFESLKLDFVLIEGQGVIVTGASQAIQARPVFEAAPEVVSEVSEPEIRELSEIPELPIPEPEKRPEVIHTPFGPVEKSGNPFIHLPPIPGEVSPLPFFAPTVVIPPAGASAVQNDLFRPISIYHNPTFTPLQTPP